jgi:phage FluMu protein Com
MAIRTMKKGEIKCDKCGKLIAQIRTSEVLFDYLEGEERFTEIQYVNCPLTIN